MEHIFEHATSSEEEDIKWFLETFNTVSYSSDSTDSSSDEETEPSSFTKFVEEIEAFKDDAFKSHFRVRRTTAKYLIERFAESEHRPYVRNGGRATIDFGTKVYMYIWYISNTVTFGQLGCLFSTSKSSAWLAVRSVAHWLISISPEFIKWPQGAAAKKIMDKFESRNKIPGVIGAIDCTNIGINAPTANKECYFYRKQNYCLVLQAVVDADKKFINIFCGEPGSLHDSRVLRRSSFYQKAEANYEEMFPESSFILGDSAYFPTKWLVPPFKDNGHITALQRDFNYIHSSTRIVVENSFGLLKGRFRRLLKFTEQRDLCAVTNLVASACVLHNICITKDDLCEESESSDTSDNPITINDPSFEPTTHRREVLFNYLQTLHVLPLQR